MFHYQVILVHQIMDDVHYLNKLLDYLLIYEWLIYYHVIFYVRYLGIKPGESRIDRNNHQEQLVMELYYEQQLLHVDD
jgi:hypothetical protein